MTTVGDRLQSSWDTLLDATGLSQTSLHVIGCVLVPLTAYWTIGLLFLYVDATGKPQWMLRYKVQDPNPNYPIEKSRLIEVMKQVVFNQAALQIPVSLLYVYLRESRGYDDIRDLPSLPRFVLEAIVFIVAEEFLFYYLHRVLHNPWIYKYIHKKHHTWQTPFGLTAVYCHPLEHFLCNMLPVAFGPYFMGAHLVTTTLWFTVASLNAVATHSGFHLPFLPSPEAHDYHHLKFNQNYGVFGFLDWLHGTDSVFRSTKPYDRHIVLLSLVPIKQLIPDEDGDAITS